MPAVSRREFLSSAALGAAGAGRAQPKSDELLGLAARAVTKPGDRKLHHFFGYYDKSPWDQSGRYLLANQVGFADRQPGATDALTVGMVDLSAGDRYVPLGTTVAWSWQQGAMLQWVGAGEREVAFNSLAEGEPAATVLDVRTGKGRTLPRPIYALSADGQRAASLDFARLHRLRPGYGYASYKEQFADDPAPEKLGVWHMDMASGKNALVVTLKQLAAFKPDERFKGAHHWVNHLLFSPGGTRLTFLHRWKPPGATSWQTRMLTCKPDGTDLRIAFDDGMVSHFDWRDDTSILAWARTKKDGTRFHLVDVLTGETKPFGTDVLTQDGHCSYSPDRRWVLNDTYPDKDRLQTLMLYKVATGRRYDLNRFLSPKQYTGPVRCDLHPRWRRDGKAVCFDGSHDAQRQVYVVDVGDVAKS
jgi:hypothetical protein